MQTCSIECRLGPPGPDAQTTVFMENVTPPEVSILQHIHGPGSCEFRGEMDEKKHVHAVEIERLRNKYRVRDQMGGRMPVFGMLFPGANPTLPLRFSDIGFGQDSEPAEVRILPPKAKPAAKKAAKKAGKVKDEDGEPDEVAQYDYAADSSYADDQASQDTPDAAE